MSKELEQEARKLQDTLYAKFTIPEVSQLLYVAKKTGLDPFSRQIYATKRWDKNLGCDKVNIQASIDGFRVVAERSGKYVGQVGPFWHDGTQWLDYWISNKPPVAAKVGVLRSDFKEVLWAFARYDAYVQKTKDNRPTMIWSSMPELMVAKCAEALALRKAFPQDLSGIYSSDEINHDEQSTQDPIVDQFKAPKPDYDAAKAAVQQKEPIVFAPNPMLRLQDAAKAYAWTGEQMRIFMQSRFGKFLVKELTEKEITLLCEIMNSQSHVQAMEELKGSVK